MPTRRHAVTHNVTRDVTRRAEAPSRSISRKLRFSVLARDKHRCRYCGVGSDVATLEIDHVIPFSKGGPTVFDNLVAACQDCNGGKSALELRAIPSDAEAGLATVIRVPVEVRAPATLPPAAPVEATPCHPLIGMAFLSFDQDGDIHQQGEIEAVAQRDGALCAKLELYSWWSGEPNGAAWVPVAALYAGTDTGLTFRLFADHCERNRYLDQTAGRAA